MNDGTCLVVEFDDVCLSPKRLCHVNFDNLVSINNMKRVRGLPKLKKPNNVICRQFQLGNMKKFSFKRFDCEDKIHFRLFKNREKFRF